MKELVLIAEVNCYKFSYLFFKIYFIWDWLWYSVLSLHWGHQHLIQMWGSSPNCCTLLLFPAGGKAVEDGPCTHREEASDSCFILAQLWPMQPSAE